MPCQSFYLSSSNTQANVWKSANWEENLSELCLAQLVSDVGNVLVFGCATFLQSLTCLEGLSLHLCLESSVEVAVVQSAGTTACQPVFSGAFEIKANEPSII